jgi:hypothetical protein
LNFGWGGDFNEFLASLEEQRERESDRERKPGRREELVDASYDTGTAIPESIETNHLKFRLLNLLGSSGI